MDYKWTINEYDDLIMEFVFTRSMLDALSKNLDGLSPTARKRRTPDYLEAKKAYDSEELKLNRLKARFGDGLMIFPGSIRELRELGLDAKLVDMPGLSGFVNISEKNEGDPMYNYRDTLPGMDVLLERRVMGIARASLLVHRTDEALGIVVTYAGLPFTYDVR